MKVIPEKAIDHLYIEELEEIAKFHKDTIDEALKQCIACYHKDIKKYIKKDIEDLPFK